MVKAVGCIIIRDRNILLLERRPGVKGELTWGLPGGKVSHGEGYLEAIRREVEEETSLVFDDDDFMRSDVGTSSYIVYIVQSANDAPVRINPYEHNKYMWLPISDITQEKRLYPGLKELLTNAFTGKQE